MHLLGVREEREQSVLERMNWLSLFAKEAVHVREGQLKEGEGETSPVEREERE